jgi:ankyrin repeat protein
MHLFRIVRGEELYVAAQEGDLARMKSLLSTGVDPDSLFDGSEPAICAAVNSDCIPCIEILIKYGAKDFGCSAGGISSYAQSKEMRQFLADLPQPNPKKH